MCLLAVWVCVMCSVHRLVVCRTVRVHGSPHSSRSVFGQMEMTKDGTHHRRLWRMYRNNEQLVASIPYKRCNSLLFLKIESARSLSRSFTYNNELELFVWSPLYVLSSCRTRFCKNKNNFVTNTKRNANHGSANECKMLCDNAKQRHESAQNVNKCMSTMTTNPLPASPTIPFLRAFFSFPPFSSFPLCNFCHVFCFFFFLVCAATYGLWGASRLCMDYSPINHGAYFTSPIVRWEFIWHLIVVRRVCIVVKCVRTNEEITSFSAARLGSCSFRTFIYLVLFVWLRSDRAHSAFTCPQWIQPTFGQQIVCSLQTPWRRWRRGKEWKMKCIWHE